MKALLFLLSLLPWQNILQEAKHHYMICENDSCAVKVAMVRDYCLSNPDEKGVTELIVDVENVLGALAQASGCRDSAAVHYRNAYNGVMRIEDRGKAPIYCINLADILRQEGNAPEAAQWLRRALTLSDSLSVHELNCAVNTQLGQVYSDLRNFPMAESYFEAAEKECVPGSFDDYFLANARGNACFFNEDYVKAIPFFRRARAAARLTGNESNVRITEINLGECFLSLHQLDSASVYIDSSYNFWSKDGNRDDYILAAICGMKAGLALERNNLKDAENWISSGNGRKTSSIYTDIINRHIMEISVLKGDWKRAYEYSRKTKAYSDSLFRRTMASNFIEAEMRYSRDTTVLRQQLRIVRQKAEISRLVGCITAILLALIVCVLIILCIQADRKKERVRTEEMINKLKLENLKTVSISRKITIEDSSQDRFVTADEMVLLSYLSDTRRWQVLLKDGSECLMKRNSTARNILDISPCFTRLNQQTIVNVDYIKSIGVKSQKCVLVEPFNNISLSFSRRSVKNVNLGLHPDEFCREPS